jgi:LysR family cys regulon transcriptional activator
LATTHTFSRYFLPRIVEEYRKNFDRVALHIYQSDGAQTNDDLDKGKLDFALVHDGEKGYHDKIQLPCFYWRRALIVPKGHALANRESINFDILAQYPLLTHTSLGGNKNYVEEKFKEQGFKPDIVFAATDCEVIKSYVRMGMGVGVIASMAYEEDKDSDLVAIDLSHLIPPSLVNVVYDKNFYFREYIFAFIEALAPHLNRDLLIEAQQTRSQSKMAKLVNKENIPIR